MKCLRLIWIAPANYQVQTERGEEKRTKTRRIVMPSFRNNNSLAKASLSLTRRIVMPSFHNNFSLARASLSLMLLLLVSVAAVATSAQENSTRPLAYSVENTGANNPAPVFPTFAQLPIIRPLTDPFRFADGTRDTSFASWERRRSEIKAAIEKYEIGPKPDCSDCAITATYTPPASRSASGSLSVVVTRNGKSLTLTSNVRSEERRVGKECRGRWSEY